jgi:hypothetical protein
MTDPERSHKKEPSQKLGSSFLASKTPGSAGGSKSFSYGEKEPPVL